MARKGDYAKMTDEQKKKLFEQVLQSRKKLMTRFEIVLHNEYDADIIAYLDQCQSRSAFLKYLVREYAKSHEKPEL